MTVSNVKSPLKRGGNQPDRNASFIKPLFERLNGSNRHIGTCFCNNSGEFISASHVLSPKANGEKRDVFVQDGDREYEIKEVEHDETDDIACFTIDSEFTPKENVVVVNQIPQRLFKKLSKRFSIGMSGFETTSDLDVHSKVGRTHIQNIKLKASKSTLREDGFLRRVEVTARTKGGNSGSPFYVEQNGTCYVIGILLTGETFDSEFACFANPQSLPISSIPWEDAGVKAEDHNVVLLACFALIVAALIAIYMVVKLVQIGGKTGELSGDVTSLVQLADETVRGIRTLGDDSRLSSTMDVMGSHTTAFGDLEESRKFGTEDIKQAIDSINSLGSEQQKLMLIPRLELDVEYASRQDDFVGARKSLTTLQSEVNSMQDMIMLRFGHLEYDAGNLSKALEHYKKYLNVNPGDIGCQLLAAKCEEEMGYLDLAIARLEKITIEQNPNYSGKYLHSYFAIRNNLSAFYYQNEEFKKAAAIVLPLVEQTPIGNAKLKINEFSVSRMFAISQAANAYSKLGDRERAEKYQRLLLVNLDKLESSDFVKKLKFIAHTNLASMSLLEIDSVTKPTAIGKNHIQQAKKLKSELKIPNTELLAIQLAHAEARYLFKSDKDPSPAVESVLAFLPENINEIPIEKRIAYARCLNTQLVWRFDKVKETKNLSLAMRAVTDGDKALSLIQNLDTQKSISLKREVLSNLSNLRSHVGQRFHGAPTDQLFSAARDHMQEVLKSADAKYDDLNKLSNKQKLELAKIYHNCTQVYNTIVAAADAIDAGDKALACIASVKSNEPSIKVEVKIHQTIANLNLCAAYLIDPSMENLAKALTAIERAFETIHPLANKFNNEQLKQIERHVIHGRATVNRLLGKDVTSNREFESLLWTGPEQFQFEVATDHSFLLSSSAQNSVVDGKAALELVSMARNKLTVRDSFEEFLSLRAEADAYARLGDFAKAQKIHSKALQIAPKWLSDKSRTELELIKSRFENRTPNSYEAK